MVNGDDKEAEKFLAVFSGKKIVYGKKTLRETISSEGVSFNWNGVRIGSSLPGEFNLYNILAAVSFGNGGDTTRENPVGY